MDQKPFLLPAGVQWIEPMEEVVDEMVERGILVGVWHSWYFPKSGHGWGWISGPGTSGVGDNGAMFDTNSDSQEIKFEIVPAKRSLN